MLRGLFLIVFLGTVFVLASSGYASVALEDQKINDKAGQTSLALRNGRYDDAEAIIQSVVAESKIKNWSYSPFDTFISKVTESRDSSWLPYFDGWADAHKKSPMPYLFRAKYYYQMALGDDGEVGGKLTSRELLKHMAYVSMAWKDILQAEQLGDKTPYGAYLFLHISRLAASVADRENIFDAAIKTYPDYYFLYSDRLNQLSPKSGGSAFQMMYFTYDNTINLPPASPMRMLGLDLYLDLIADVESDCQNYDDNARILCEKRQGDLLHSPSLIAKAKDAFGLYKAIGPYEFNQALVSKLWCRCFATSPYAQTMFGVLQEGLGNDNYAVNEGYGYLNYNQKSYSRALEYYQKALNEIKAFPFPAEDRKNAALADMYYNISLASAEQGENKNALDSINRAMALNSDNADYYRQRCLLDKKIGGQKETLSDCLKGDMAKSYTQE